MNQQDLELMFSVRPFELRQLLGGALTDEQAAALLRGVNAAHVDQLHKLWSLPPGGLEMMRVGLQRRAAPTTRRLRDGTTGYHVRGSRADDCWAAAVATCLQVPIEEVPDPRLDQRLQAGEDAEDVNRQAWLEFGRWLNGRGLRIARHNRAPVRRRRWIGVIEFPGLFMNHCLVMDRDEILFDPVDPTRLARRVRTYTPADVGYAFTFQRRRR